MDIRKKITQIFHRTSEKQFSSVPSVFIADRGYESYNNMAHIQQIGQFFLFRCKDINSNGILRGFDLPDNNQFDFPVSLTLYTYEMMDVH